MRLASAVTLLLGAITLFTVTSPYVIPIIQNRNIWAAISLIAILLFTSGHMFNHIRKVPYVAGDGRGGISYFAGGFSNQFGMETQIVAAMCKCHSHDAISTHATFLTVSRWHTFLRSHRISLESSTHGRCQDAAIGCHYLGRHPSRHIQLPSQRF